MARKAVQGYPEKSYYDNTRYLGMVATTDPLNEGLFKHLVNFDISDTGQSLQPREGFLTTTLKNNASILSLSNKTIMFKDNRTNEYVIYDLLTNLGYIANVSAYKLVEKLLPITSAVDYIQWTTAVTFLINQVSFIKSFYNAISGTLTQKYEGTRDYIRQYLNIIPDTKIEHIYDENGVSKTLLRVEFKQPDPNDPNTILNSVNFILQMYYRKDAITLNGVTVSEFVPILGTNVLQGANTLIFEVVDTFTHPTLAATDRNLAVSKSIIPEVFQTLYTAQSRPDGHISNLGNFVYIYDNLLNYVNNFIAFNTNYNIKPYFSLNPAHVDLNNPVQEAATNHWAYRFDIFNTSTELTDKNKDVVYRSPWMKYGGTAVQPIEIFTTNRRNTVSLENSNRTLNHYKDARYVIFLVPKTIGNKTSNIKTIENGVTISQTYPAVISGSGLYNTAGEGQVNETFASIQARQSNWFSIIDSIKDIYTLRQAINSLSSTANFYVYDLYNAPSTELLNVLDNSMSDNTVVNSIKTFVIDKPNNIESAAYDIFLEAREVINLIESQNIFQKENVVFKSLPFATNNKYIETNKRHTFQKSALFGIQDPIFYYAEVTTAPTYAGYALNTVIQNIYNSRVYQLTSLSPITWTLQGAASTTPYNINLLKDELYLEAGTSNWYRWNGTNRYFTETTTFIGGLVKEADAPSDVQITNTTYQWVFDSLNYWNDAPASLVYKNAYNNFLSGKYEFFKLINNNYSVEFSLDDLKKVAEGAPISFTSSSRFGTQAPHYVTSVPSFTAPENYIVHRSTQGFFYKQTAVGSGNTWQIVEENSIIVIESLPPAFVLNKLYLDLRTNRRYVWNNSTGLNGFLSPLEATALEGLPSLDTRGFFEKGLNGIFYMKPYEESELLDDQSQIKNYSDTETLKVAWDAIAFKQTFNVQFTFDSLSTTYINQYIKDDSDNIQQSNIITSFEGNRLLVCNKNILYISEVGRYYWFKAVNKIEFPEEIIKAVEYKTIILVFTKQHLYAVYRVETTVTQLNPATNQIEQNVTGISWLKQIVLYNLLVSKEYADVIQVFNQMVLFYSEDGQLFMIRPSTTIDDQTRFSIQYFNKAVNDVLVNYHEYMNERLASYNRSERINKKDVKIKALVSINYIKMFYYVPGVMTYILIYDVLNNRYYVYDTLTFTNIYDKLFIESGELYLTEHDTKVYFSMPYVEQNVKDNFTDMTVVNAFKKEGVNCLIDTGNLNLNNHLHKRFRDLHVVFKNLNSSNLLFNLETNIDDIIAKPFYDTQLKVQDIGGVSYFVPVIKTNQNDLIELVDINQISETATDAVKYSLTNNLFENNNVLMDFSEYTSSKLLTHRTSVLGLGKVFRLKLQFISKGLYKVQHFGIIYKERRI